jgi:MFS superfamily sulfate permease-like transporter
VFFNVDYFGDRLRAAIAASRTPVEWVVVDASPINWIDATALQRIDELRSELAGREITLGVARARLSLGRAFDPNWVSGRLAATGLRRFPTVKAAVSAFTKRKLTADADPAAQVSSPGGSKADEPV